MVNESRRLIQSDRVSLTLAKGRHHRVAAISGLDTIDRRAEEVKLLGRLATIVAAAGRPLLYAGGGEDTPPQIERHLDAYLDHSHATLLYIVPLHRPEEPETASRRDASSSQPIAALVVEQFSGHRMQEGMLEAYPDGSHPQRVRAGQRIGPREFVFAALVACSGQGAVDCTGTHVAQNTPCGRYPVGICIGDVHRTRRFGHGR